MEKSRFFHFPFHHFLIVFFCCCFVYRAHRNQVNRINLPFWKIVIESKKSSTSYKHSTTGAYTLLFTFHFNFFFHSHIHTFGNSFFSSEKGNRLLLRKKCDINKLNKCVHFAYPRRFCLHTIFLWFFFCYLFCFYI